MGVAEFEPSYPCNTAVRSNAIRPMRNLLLTQTQEHSYIGREPGLPRTCSPSERPYRTGSPRGDNVTRTPRRAARFTLVRIRRHVPATAAAGLCAALALSACSSTADKHSESPSSAAATPPATQDAKQQAALDAALAAWRGMRTEQVKAYRQGRSSGTKLSTYAADKALSKIEGELFQYRRAGVHFEGEPKSTAKVTAVDVESIPQKATITECLDTTGWKALQGSKNVTSPNQVRRYTVIGSVRTIGRQWKVVDYDVDKEHTC